MKVTRTAIQEVLRIEPLVFTDERGFLYESYNKSAFLETTGLDVTFVQENHTHGARGVLRGLHFQISQPQGKLVRAVRGAVFDVAVDVRRDSATFGQWVGEILTEENRRQLWIPPGFAHGFMVLSESADFLYKLTDYYAPEYERCIAWNDPEIGIEWPLSGNFTKLSNRDAAAGSLKDYA